MASSTGFHHAARVTTATLFKRLIRTLLFAAMVLLPCSPALAADAPPVKAERLPGVEFSQGITEITGVAISPLLGVSVVGAWRYVRADAATRAALPWFCHPGVWGSGLALLLVCFLKDTFGTAVPGLLKKPLDMVELFENKASALVASAAFVPLIANEMARHSEAVSAGPAFLMPLASISGHSVVAVSTAAIYLVASVFAFFAVWLSGHAVNVLIILSPFSIVDAALKACRLAVLALIALAYLIAPGLAAGICVVIIAAAIWLAPATLRLSSFGTRYACDVLLPWFGRKRATDDLPHAFTLGRFPGLPVRTAGRMALSADGQIEFRHRPWGFMPERAHPFPDGTAELAKGLLSPSVIIRRQDDRDAKILLLLPRYRGREESIASHLPITAIRDHALARGLVAMRIWWKEQIARKEKRLDPA